MRSKHLLLVAHACLAGTLAKNLADETTPAPAIEFQVIEQTKIQAGGHAIIVNRVASPNLPLAPIVAEPVEPRIRLEQKRRVFVLLSVTVYDHEVTELRWFDEGKSYHAYSNVDFNCIASIGQFEIGGIAYELILGLGNESRAALARAERNASPQGGQGGQGDRLKSLPQAGQFPRDYSAYVLADDSADGDSQTFVALDALHAYYDANRDPLQRACREREAARIEQERLQREHPPVPQDTVINFWPAQGTVILDRQRREGKP